MSSELKKAIERIHSDDFQKMRETERKLKKNGRKGFWRRVRNTPAAPILKVVRTFVWLALIALLVFATVYYYNEYKAALVWIEHDKAIWDNELQRRANLLPKLILVSARYSEHEKVLFEYVSKMRGNLAKGGGEILSDEVDSPLNKLMSSLLAVSEQYPDLKATQSFEELMKGMSETADRITLARASYIRRIKTLNDLYSMFPSNIFGRLFFITNLDQYKMDESQSPDADVEDAFKKFLLDRAEAKPQSPAESIPAAVPQPSVEPERLDSPRQGNDVAVRNDAPTKNDAPGGNDQKSTNDGNAQNDRNTENIKAESE